VPRSGGGHDGVAAALGELVQQAFGGGVKQCRADIYGAGTLNLLPWMAKLRYHCDPLWRAFYCGTDNRLAVAACAAAVRPLALRRLRAQLPAAPDVLVAVHFGAAQCLQALAAGWAVPPRTVVVVTDYEAHRAWFAPADHYVVASEMAAARAREAGIASSAITRHPLLPCRRTPPQRSCRRAAASCAWWLPPVPTAPARSACRTCCAGWSGGRPGRICRSTPSVGGVAHCAARCWTWPRGCAASSCACTATSAT
jgi:hypothetical protein